MITAKEARALVEQVDFNRLTEIKEDLEESIRDYAESGRDQITFHFREEDRRIIDRLADELAELGYQVDNSTKSIIPNSDITLTIYW